MSTTGVAAAPRRRWQTFHLRWFAWMALLGMLMGPLAPRTGDRREAEETEFVDAELEDALTPSQTPLTRQRRAMGDSPNATGVLARAQRSLETPVRAGSRSRWQLPRRVPPDEDPDDA